MEVAPCFIVRLEVILMEIGEFSNITGIAIDTLRYYNKIGMLVPNRINSRRCYNEEDLEKAIAIIKLKNLNFTLEEIKSLFNFDESVDETQKLDEKNIEKVNCCLSMIEEKYKQILNKEKDIIQMKAVFEKMIHKTKKLLETGGFTDKGISKFSQGGDLT